MDKQWITVDEAALEMGVSKQTVREKLIIGDIKGNKVGREWRILKSEVNRILGISDNEDIYRKDIYIKELEKENEILKLKVKSFKTILTSLNQIVI